MITLHDGSIVSEEAHARFMKGLSSLISECPDATALLSVFARFCHGMDERLDFDSYFRSHWKQYGLIEDDGAVNADVVSLMKNCAQRNEKQFLGWSYRRPEASL